jgi:hypothetical protein
LRQAFIGCFAVLIEHDLNALTEVKKAGSSIERDADYGEHQYPVGLPNARRLRDVRES